MNLMDSRGRSPWFNGKILIGSALLLAVLLLELVGPFFWNTNLAVVGTAPTNIVPIWTEADPSLGFKEGTWDHPLGTDSKGRDMLAVLIVATPRSLRVGFIAATVGMLVGTFLGFTAGMLGGWADTCISALADAAITIPGLAVLIVIASYVEHFEINTMALLIALFSWPIPTRLLRVQVMTLRERGYVQMAQISGASLFGIMFGEIMPNLLPYLASSFTAAVSGAILAATGLETLGLGPTRIPTLGMTINQAIRASAILRGMWWWWGLPIVMLVLIFVALFVITIGLDEIANPRLRRAK